MYNQPINSPAAHAGMTRQWRAQDRGDKSLLKMSRLKQKCKSRLDFQTRVTILAETYVLHTCIQGKFLVLCSLACTAHMVDVKFSLNTFKICTEYFFKIFNEYFIQNFH